MSRIVLAWLILLISAIAARADLVEDCDQQRDCELRLKACSELIDKGESSGERLGDLYVKRGQAQICKGGSDSYALAIADYTKAIEIDPRSAKAFVARGQAYLNKNKLDEATQDFGSAIELDPADVVAVRYRGLAFFAAGQYDRALADLDKAVALSPDDIANYFRRGEIRYAAGQHEQALADFTKAIELKPTPETYGMRAYYYGQLGQYERAVADYGKMIELLPNCETCYFNRGAAYEKAGDKQQAIADFRKALALKDSYRAPRAALERLGEKP
jgi:tetratricopeptide (TPR) repeat protein